jgi:hypothetical protein
MERSEIELTEQSAEAKCPYLAGRPPHGTYKLCPSHLNVCYARAQGNKSYGQVSKETQTLICFGGGDVHRQCPDLQRAEAASVMPPKLGHTTQVTTEETVRRVRKRRSKKRRWYRRIALKPILTGLTFVTLLCATIFVVTLVMRK